MVIGKVPDAGKDRGQKEKRASGDEMAGQHHQCNEHELGQTPGDDEGQGGLVCCCPRDREESDTTWRLTNNNKSDRPGCMAKATPKSQPLRETRTVSHPDSMSTPT